LILPPKVLPRHIFLLAPPQVPSVEMLPELAAQVPNNGWHPAWQCAVVDPQKPLELQQSPIDISKASFVLPSNRLPNEVPLQDSAAVPPHDPSFDNVDAGAAEEVVELVEMEAEDVGVEVSGVVVTGLPVPPVERLDRLK